MFGVAVNLPDATRGGTCCPRLESSSLLDALVSTSPQSTLFAFSEGVDAWLDGLDANVILIPFAKEQPLYSCSFHMRVATYLRGFL